MPGKLCENSTGSDVGEQVIEKVCGLSSLLRSGTKQTAHLKPQNDKLGATRRKTRAGCTPSPSPF